MNKLRWIAVTMAILNGLLGLAAGIYLLFPISLLIQSVLHFNQWRDSVLGLGCILIAIPGYVIWWTYCQAARNKPTRSALWTASAAYNGIGIALGVWGSLKGAPYPFFLWPLAMALLSLWARQVLIATTQKAEKP